MLRDVQRLRQEFLTRREHETVHRAIDSRKKQLRSAMDAGTPMPGHLVKDAVSLKKFVELDDDQTKDALNNIDDEYALAGVEDPKIFVTTSREPSQKLLEFAKEVRLMFPGATRVNRGGTSVHQLMLAARRDQFTDVVVLGESRGVPDSMTISHLPLGPTIIFTLHNVVTRHDIENVGHVSEQAPHLIYEGFSTALGLRVSKILKFLYPVPREDATRIITFENANDFISFRHHTYAKAPGTRASATPNIRGIILTEIGPRFEMQPYRILLGTLEMDDADIEGTQHPYTNTAKKRRLL